MTQVAKVQAAAADPTAPGWIKRVALLTGVLAALAGFLTVRGTNLANEAIYHSNQGVLFQAQASDAWAEYQAASVKARIVETVLLTLVTAHGDDIEKAKQDLNKEREELRDRQPPLKAKAQEFEHKREMELASGWKRLKEKDIVAYAGVTVQLGIALASVAALTRRREAFVLALFLGLAGMLITTYAIIGPRIFKEDAQARPTTTTVAMQI